MKVRLITYFSLFTITMLFFWQTGSFEFINYDDPYYVYENSHVTSGLTLDNIRWAMTATEMGNWNPLTWLSHMLDCELYGLNPKGHHLTNTFLHALNTLLLCVALFRVTGRFFPSAFVAALFSLHPMHVESVAWVAERKDLLCGLFFMLTILAYAHYIEQPGVKRYLLVAASFTLGLASKPMLVTLPLVLLLLDFWPLCRCNPGNTNSGKVLSTPLYKILLEKVPLLLLSSAVSVITLVIQNNHRALLHTDQHSVASRLANVAVGYTSYILKTFWPDDLAIFYPINNNPPIAKVIGSVIILMCITIFVLQKREKHPFLLTGWFWYLIMLAPVIGFLQAGLQSRADRYTYLPLTGIFIIITWGASTIFELWTLKFKSSLATFLAVIIISGLALVTSRQLAYWKNGITLYTHTLSVTRNNFTVHYNLAATLANKGLFDQAIFHYQEAIKTAPVFFEEAYMSLGFELAEQGKFKDAVYYHSEVLRMNPGNSAARERMKATMTRIISSH